MKNHIASKFHTHSCIECVKCVKTQPDTAEVISEADLAANCLRPTVIKIAGKHSKEQLNEPKQHNIQNKVTSSRFSRILRHSVRTRVGLILHHPRTKQGAHAQLFTLCVSGTSRDDECNQ